MTWWYQLYVEDGYQSPIHNIEILIPTCTYETCRNVVSIVILHENVHKSLRFTISLQDVLYAPQKYLKQL